MSGSVTRKYLHRELERSIGNLLWCKLHLSRCLEIFINQTLQEANLSVEQILDIPLTSPEPQLSSEEFEDSHDPSQEEQDRVEQLLTMADELNIPERYTLYVKSLCLTIRGIDLTISNIVSTKATL